MEIAKISIATDEEDIAHTEIKGPATNVLTLFATIAEKLADDLSEEIVRTVFDAAISKSKESNAPTSETSSTEIRRVADIFGGKQ